MSKRIADWGRVAGDAVVFGGAASNAHALLALLRRAKRSGAGALLGGGDTVAYCGDPARTVRLMRRAGLRSIAGNCEASLAAGAAGCGCGFAAGSACDRASAAWFGHARAALDGAALEWMAGLPELAVFRAHGRRWGVLHGGVAEQSRFLWPGDPPAALAAEIAAFEALAGPVDGIVAHHCGLPFQARVGRHLWLNPGSLGMPPNDGDPRTSFAVIGPGGPVLHRLDYDWRGAAAAMRRAGLVQGYERALQSGFWPSEEVLPPRLRRRAA